MLLATGHFVDGLRQSGGKGSRGERETDRDTLGTQTTPGRQTLQGHRDRVRHTVRPTRRDQRSSKQIDEDARRHGTHIDANADRWYTRQKGKKQAMVLWYLAAFWGNML